MVIHADYLITGILKIVKTEKGFIFSNPGTLKLPLPAIYEGGHSVARNPRIQTMFRMIGYGDNIGSGFPAILSAWGEENWRKPDLSQNEELHQVELKLWMISLMPSECTEYLQKLFGLAYLNLNNEEQIILGTAYLEGGVTNERVQSIINRDSTKIGHMLADLVEKQMLIADKKGRWTSYRLNEIYEIQQEQFEFRDIHHKEVMLQNETDQCIYEYIKANGFVTTQQVVEITKITTTQGASVALGRMMKQNLIKKVRRGKHFIYELK